MKVRKPTFLNRVKAALAVLTGKAWLFMPANSLQARWMCVQGEGKHLNLRLDIRLNDVSYSARRTFLCDAEAQADRDKILSAQMASLLAEVMEAVLIGGRK